MITISATNCSLLVVSPRKFLFHFFKGNIIQINNDLLNREKRYLSDESEINLYIVNTVFHRRWVPRLTLWFTYWQAINVLFVEESLFICECSWWLALAGLISYVVNWEQSLFFLVRWVKLSRHDHARAAHSIWRMLALLATTIARDKVLIASLTFLWLDPPTWPSHGLVLVAFYFFKWDRISNETD